MARRRLQGSVVPVARLAAGQRQRMWEIFHASYEGTSQAAFERDLAGKKAVILVHDPQRRLQGFSTLTWWVGRHEGRRFQAIFSGDTVIERAYWGDGTLQRMFLRAALQRALLRPLDPLYWFLISKGYKTYLLLARHVPEHWPRPGQKTPAWEASLLGHLASERFGAGWDPGRGIVRIPQGGHVRPGLAPPDGAASDPDVAFFLAANPGHADGDELACLGRLRLWLPARYAWHRARRRRRAA